jgi:hypothetical protein
MNLFKGLANYTKFDTFNKIETIVDWKKIVKHYEKSKEAGSLLDFLLLINNFGDNYF